MPKLKNFFNHKVKIIILKSLDNSKQRSKEDWNEKSFKKDWKSFSLEILEEFLTAGYVVF